MLVGMQAPGAIMDTVNSAKQDADTQQSQCQSVKGTVDQVAEMEKLLASLQGAKALNDENFKTIDAMTSRCNEIKQDLGNSKKQFLKSTVILLITLIAVTAVMLIHLITRRTEQKVTIGNLQSEVQNLELKNSAVS